MLSYKKFLEKKYAIALHTVDIANMRMKDGKLQVLLCQKKKEFKSDKKIQIVIVKGKNYTITNEKIPLKDCWRFPGGFVDPELDSSTEDAVIRELYEETHAKISGEPMYLGSTKVILDERFKDKKDKIITSFYATKHFEGAEDGKGYDDILHTKWFNLSDLNESIENPIHSQLFYMIKEKFKNA